MKFSGGVVVCFAVVTFEVPPGEVVTFSAIAQAQPAIKTTIKGNFSFIPSTGLLFIFCTSLSRKRSRTPS